MTALAQLVGQRSIIICSGSGGVGKTTTAATLALEGARQGRKACVVTIDPAKRLADALGLAGGLTNEPRRIAGPWPGELWAVLDHRHAAPEASVRLRQFEADIPPTEHDQVRGDAIEL